MSFFDGILIGIGGYWLFGLFSKGFAEPIQTHLGKLFIAKLQKKNIALKERVEKSITKIDDILLSAPIDMITQVNNIVNAEDDKYKQLLDQTFKITSLLSKIKHSIN